MQDSGIIYRNSLKLLLRASTIVFISIFLVRFVVYALGASYDWDIDHEMYFGSRLLKGELLFTKEINDKLPFVQFLFALPAALGSVSYWIMLSAIFAIIASANMFTVVKQIILDDWPAANRRIAVEVALFSSTFYLFLISVMPGSIVVISSTAASMALIAICLQFTNCRRSKAKDPQSVPLYLISAILATLAISLRPYLAPAIILVGFWIPIRRLTATSSNHLKLDNLTTTASGLGYNLKYVVSYALVWMVSLIILGVVINVGPYMVTNNLDHFTKGMLLNSQRLNPQSTLSNIVSQVTALIEMSNAAFMLASVAFIVPFSVALNRLMSFRSLNSLDASIRLIEIDLIFSGLIPAFLIETSILGRHFWPHYQQLFAPFIALSLALSIAYIKNVDFIKVELNTGPMQVLILIVVFVILFGRFEIAKSVRNVGPHRQAEYSEAVKKFVEIRKQKDLPADFLHINSMYIHWKLGESRHGFPSAAHIEGIYFSWWPNVDKNNTDNLYTLPEDLCKAFQAKGPSIIFINRSALAYKCFSSPDNSYYNSESFPGIPAEYAILIRK